MHPAASIIVFTVFSGVGYGLAAVLALGLVDAASKAAWIGYGLALVLIGMGLVSSTLHLGNPQRAWRAFSQWRSSWLSREGVMALISFAFIALAAYLSIFTGQWNGLLGLACALLALLTVYCTAMIYGCLKSVDAWYTGLTPACYIGFALAGGLLTAAALAAFQGQAFLLSVLACVALVVAWGLKFVWRSRMMALTPLSTTGSATMLGKMGKVRMLEAPHQNPNYLTREMGFRIARKHADKLFAIALILGAVIPFAITLGVALSGGGSWAGPLLVLAVVAHVGGVLTERWLFFAEARHSVVAFYGR